MTVGNMETDDTFPPNTGGPLSTEGTALMHPGDGGVRPLSPEDAPVSWLSYKRFEAFCTENGIVVTGKLNEEQLTKLSSLARAFTLDAALREIKGGAGGKLLPAEQMAEQAQEYYLHYATPSQSDERQRQRKAFRRFHFDIAMAARSDYREIVETHQLMMGAWHAQNTVVYDVAESLLAIQGMTINKRKLYFGRAALRSVQRP